MDSISVVPTSTARPVTEKHAIKTITQNPPHPVHSHSRVSGSWNEEMSTRLKTCMQSSIHIVTAAMKPDLVCFQASALIY